MTIWHDPNFYLLLGIIFSGLIIWYALQKFSYLTHQYLFAALSVYLVLAGLFSNGIGVYFLIQPFYDLVSTIIISVSAIIFGIFFLIMVFIQFGSKK